jgi:hypothetical protein
MPENVANHLESNDKDWSNKTFDPGNSSLHPSYHEDKRMYTVYIDSQRFGAVP